MNGYKDKLVEIYASCPLNEMWDIPAYHELCEEYGKNRSFNSFRNKIERIKQRLEETVEKQSSEKGQISESLRLISKLAKDKDEDVLNYCYKLIIRAYHKNWNQEQLNYFEKISTELTKTYDYFLSFSRRNPSVDECNTINNNYKHFITSTIGGHWFTSEKICEKNLLARSIHHFLKDKGYEGFFYPEYIGDSKIVNKKVEHACRNSLVFVQLIQNIMFKIPDVDNYCFIEYNYAINTFLEEAIIFVLAESHRENFIKDYNVCLEYAGWHEHVLNKDIIILSFTMGKKDAHGIKGELEKNLYNRINDYKRQLIENVP